MPKPRKLGKQLPLWEKLPEKPRPERKLPPPEISVAKAAQAREKTIQRTLRILELFSKAVEERKAIVDTSKISDWHTKHEIGRDNTQHEIEISKIVHELRKLGVEQAVGEIHSYRSKLSPLEYAEIALQKQIAKARKPKTEPARLRSTVDMFAEERLNYYKGHRPELKGLELNLMLAHDLKEHFGRLVEINVRVGGIEII